jgi:hypothetical protein
VAGSGRKNADAALALALAGGATVEAAARSAGVSPRTAFRRSADPAFRALVDDFRAETVRQFVGQLSALGTSAVGALGELLQSEDQRVRLAAVRVALAGLLKASGLFEFERRLQEVDAGPPAQQEEMP